MWNYERHFWKLANQSLVSNECNYLQICHIEKLCDYTPRYSKHPKHSWISSSGYLRHFLWPFFPLNVLLIIRNGHSKPLHVNYIHDRSGKYYNYSNSKLSFYFVSFVVWKCSLEGNYKKSGPLEMQNKVRFHWYM